MDREGRVVDHLILYFFKRLMRCLVLITFALAISVPITGTASAHSFVRKDFDQLVAEAEAIFVGTVTGSRSYRLATGVIATDFTLASSAWLKGGTPSSEVVLTFLGGTIDNESMEAAGWPRLEVNKTYLVFAKGNGRRAFPVVGGDTGLFEVVSAADGRQLVLDAHGHDVDLTLRKIVSELNSACDSAAALTLECFLSSIQTELTRR